MRIWLIYGMELNSDPPYQLSGAATPGAAWAAWRRPTHTGEARAEARSERRAAWHGIDGPRR